MSVAPDRLCASPLEATVSLDAPIARASMTTSRGACRRSAAVVAVRRVRTDRLAGWRRTAWGTPPFMGVPRPDKAAERPLDEMVQTVSEQAVVLARKELELARSELTAKAKQAAGGAAMLGGAALLGTLAAGTGTAGIVLLLSRRPGPSAAALGVAGVYALGGAGLAKEGVSRLRGAAPPVPEETVESVKGNLGSSKKKKRAKPPRST